MRLGGRSFSSDIKPTRRFDHDGSDLVFILSGERRAVHFGSRAASSSGLRPLARLRAQNQPRLKFAFGLQPIVQLTPGLFAAFKIDFIRPAPDLLFTRRVPC